MTGARTAKMVVEAKFVNWVSVDSSVFTSAAYHCDKRQLFLRFHSGKISRFLILPWVGVPNLASHILSLAARQMPRDWWAAYRAQPVLLETLVDAEIGRA